MSMIDHSDSITITLRMNTFLIGYHRIDPSFPFV